MPESTVAEDFGQNIKHRHAAHPGISQDALAKLVGIDITAFANVKRTERNVSLTNAGRTAAALGTTPPALRRASRVQTCTW
ncbi:helix-turn-helix domain-containing protein [Rathayibacter soli]|uniref:helix-turn-helix domain-containing protein n=1 Tax=Rathayibacter soli TaxID=3144168 RepID=UPI0027E53CEE|nr:helix-turn-helix transcriptional regulator [Glaciibacter superstes]